MTFCASFLAVNLILKALYIPGEAPSVVECGSVETQTVKFLLSSSNLSVLLFIGLGVVCLVCRSALITSCYAVWSLCLNVAFVSLFPLSVEEMVKSV